MQTGDGWPMTNRRLFFSVSTTGLRYTLGNFDCVKDDAVVNHEQAISIQTNLREEQTCVVLFGCVMREAGNEKTPIEIKAAKKKSLVKIPSRLG